MALWDNFKPTPEANFPLVPPFQLSMLRISPSMGHVLDMNMSLRHLLFLLEYCMVTGYDWWDILLHVQPSMVQNLVEKLHEEYMRQNAALQQVGGALGSLPGWAWGGSGAWSGEQPVAVVRTLVVLCSLSA